MRVLGWVSGGIYTILTLALISSYVYLIRALKTSFRDQQAVLKKLTTDINVLYLVLVLVFTLETAY